MFVYIAPILEKWLDIRVLAPGQVEHKFGLQGSPIIRIGIQEVRPPNRGRKCRVVLKAGNMQDVRWASRLSNIHSTEEVGVYPKDDMSCKRLAASDRR